MLILSTADAESDRFQDFSHLVTIPTHDQIFRKFDETSVLLLNDFLTYEKF